MVQILLDFIIEVMGIMIEFEQRQKLDDVYSWFHYPE